ncbi:centrosomal protein of 44 kDa isoform X1 [Sander lucioperca]|uniref:Centrosomal protein of 44 kDa n=1 Tax=Sander lucioperca TaxID=283035 RepID=A0A8D0CSB8_SANLU|nr:centrosomal protein of 44 kDa isoform X1 [Sander lucioperca]XP_035856063.1 centrosomal protein of 44 kDa isoform X1 [Sander lucioperca]
MLSSGDVHGCLRKLETLLRVIKYPGNVDYNGLSKGDPSAFLPIVSFTFTSFSPPFAKQLLEAGLELTGKTDLRFTDTLYKVLRDIFHYKPILTKQQFLQWGFSLRKISVICDVINLVLQKHNQLKKPKVRCPASHKDDRGEAHPTITDADTVSERPFVVSHAENCSTSHTNSTNYPQAEAFSPHYETYTSHNEVHSSNSPANGIKELVGREEDKDNSLYSSEVEGRLSALEAQLGGLLSGLDRLSILEKRLEELDKPRNTDKNEGQVITISRESWENLMSRVLLLETKQDLSNIQLSVPPPCPLSASSCSSSSKSDASKEDLKDRLERITNMLKSTSSLLKNTESSAAHCK